MTGRHDYPEFVDAAAIEATLHGVICQALQKISDEYGIQVESIRASWTDVSTTTGPAFKVRRTVVESFADRK